MASSRPPTLVSLLGRGGFRPPVRSRTPSGARLAPQSQPQPAADPADVTPQVIVNLTAPDTPRRQRIADVVGDENMGDLHTILTKLHETLERLVKPVKVKPGDNPLAAERVSFLCPRVDFKNTINMADHCVKLSAYAKENSGSKPTNQSVAGLHANIASIDEKLEALIASQSTQQAAPAASYASATTKPRRASQAKKAQQPPTQTVEKAMPDVLPPRLPFITLQQTDHKNRVEITSELPDLVN